MAALTQPAASPAPETFEFCGLHLRRVGLGDAVAWITAAAQAHDPAVVVTPNINHLHLVQTSEAARDAVGGADLQLADGWPIVAASRMLGEALPERIAGIDLVDRLVQSDTEFSLAILGGPSDAAAKLAGLAARHNRVALVDGLAPGWDRPDTTRRVGRAPPGGLTEPDIRGDRSASTGAAGPRTQGRRGRTHRLLRRRGRGAGRHAPARSQAAAKTRPGVGVPPGDRTATAGTALSHSRRHVRPSVRLRLGTPDGVTLFTPPNLMLDYRSTTVGTLVTSGRSAATCACRRRGVACAGPRARITAHTRRPVVLPAGRLRTMNHEPERHLSLMESPSHTQSELRRRERPERLENGEEFMFERTAREDTVRNRQSRERPVGPPPGRSVGLGTALRRYPVLALLPVVIFAAAGITLGLRRAPVYAASTTINVGSPDIASQATPGYVQAEQTLASAYSREVTSQFVYGPVAKQLRISQGAVASRLSSSAVPSSPTFTINATGPGRQSAIQLAQIATTALQHYINVVNQGETSSTQLLNRYRRR